MRADNITKVINKFLEPFELKSAAGTDFAYYYTDNIVEYTLVVSARMDRMFREFAETLGLIHKVDVFLLSLLHEVGHHETYDELDDADITYSADIKATLTTNDCDVETYFNLPDEYAATEWAVNYINTHTAEVASLWQELQPAILQFYIDNNIEV